MDDEVTFTRKTSTMHPDTFEMVDVVTVVATSKARVQRYQGGEKRNPDGGGYEFGITTILLQLPISTTAAERGDTVTMTAIGASTDPNLLGVIATVKSDLTKTHPSKRTLVCEEVT